MGLSNAAKRARTYTATVNRNQGGGDKKAGFPYQVGRNWRTSIAFNNTNPVAGRCCSLNSYQTMTWTSYARPSRPIGSRADIWTQAMRAPVR
jgi:hypothetical protein